MSRIIKMPLREVRHVALSGGTIQLRVDKELVDKVLAEKAIAREHVRRRQFEDSVAA